MWLSLPQLVLVYSSEVGNYLKINEYIDNTKIMDLFSEPGAATTPFRPGTELGPKVKCIAIGDTVRQSKLPRSAPEWTDHEYLTKFFTQERLDSMPNTAITSGATDYLDLVKPEDFVDDDNNNVHMIKGIDPFRRHFVSIGIEVYDVEEKQSNYYIYTIFRRYSSSTSGWVICKSHYSKTGGTKHDTVLGISGSSWVSDRTRNMLQTMMCDYESGKNEHYKNSKMYDYKKHDYVEKNFIVKFYCPNSL